MTQQDTTLQFRELLTHFNEMASSMQSPYYKSPEIIDILTVNLCSSCAVLDYITTFKQSERDHGDSHKNLHPPSGTYTHP